MNKKVGGKCKKGGGDREHMTEKGGGGGHPQHAVKEDGQEQWEGRTVKGGGGASVTE